MTMFRTLMRRLPLTFGAANVKSPFSSSHGRNFSLSPLICSDRGHEKSIPNAPEKEDATTTTRRRRTPHLRSFPREESRGDYGRSRPMARCNNLWTESSFSGSFAARTAAPSPTSVARFLTTTSTDNNNKEKAAEEEKKKEKIHQTEPINADEDDDNSIIDPIVIKSDNSNVVDDDEWIPPSRPLLGDQGYSHLYIDKENEDNDENDEEEEDDEESQRLQAEYQRLKEQDKAVVLQRQQQHKEQEQEQELTMEEPSPASSSLDWLKTRRSILGVPSTVLDASYVPLPSSSSSSSSALTGTQPLIPIVKHQLFTRQEITLFLESLGGIDAVYIAVQPGGPTMGAGVRGMIIITAPSNRHLHTLATLLVKELRKRHLHEVGVNSAMDGPQGSKKDPLETWMLVDCGNLVVHVMMEDTRRHLDLEGLWTGKDPLGKVNPDDEDAVDYYVNYVTPVPDGYGAPPSQWQETLQQLEKNRYTAPHRKVVTKRNKRTRRKR